jgi:hypothetical protein
MFVLCAEHPRDAFFATRDSVPGMTAVSHGAGTYNPATAPSQANANSQHYAC